MNTTKFKLNLAGIGTASDTEARAYEIGFQAGYDSAIRMDMSVERELLNAKEALRLALVELEEVRRANDCMRGVVARIVGEVAR